ncbi:MAG: hypothetical protein F6K48_03075 [Okeania sp. SIO3H1]|nr:hypothetical protein [Okeania sp. SIO3H1]
MTDPELTKEQQEGLDFLSWIDMLYDHMQVVSKMARYIEDRHGVLGWKGIRVDIEEVTATIKSNVECFIETTNADDYLTEEMKGKYALVPHLNMEDANDITEHGEIQFLPKEGKYIAWDESRSHIIAIEDTKHKIVVKAKKYWDTL